MGHDLVRCAILGQTEISVGGIRLTPEAERRYGVALYFCANAGREISRDDVAQLFWPEHDGEAARHCLRQTLYRLRVLGVPVRSGAKSISLDEGTIEADYTPVVAEGAPPSAFLVLSDVTVLPGYVPRFSSPFARWVEEFRSAVSARMRRGLVRAIADLRRRGRYADVERLARQCLVLDPLNEEATLALAEAIALAGGKAEAVSMIENYMSEMGTNRDLRISAKILRSRVSELDRLAPSHPSAPPSLVGRNSELEWLLEILRDSKCGNPHHVCLCGDAGIGKTTLVAEFCRMALLQNSSVATVVCQRSDRRRPLGALTDLLPHLVRLPGAAGAAPDSLATLTLLSTYPRATPRVEPVRMTPVLTRKQVAVAVTDLVDAIVHEAPLILHVDNAHWIDRASAQILRALLQSRKRPFLLVSCMRGSPAQGSRRSWPLHSNRLLVRQIGPLPSAAGFALVQLLSRQYERELSQHQLEEIVAVSGGSPFYITELVRGFVALEREGRAVTLRSLIQARLQSLDNIAKAVLQAAVVLGKYATVDRLERVVELPAYRMARALAELEAEGLLVISSQDLQSRHELISEVCRDLIPASVHALFHKRASAVLERDAEQRAAPALLWQSAQHAESANLQEDARRILERLGKYLLGVGSAVEACQAIERSLQTGANESESLRLLAQLVEAYRIAGDWRSLRRTIARRRALSERAGVVLLETERDLLFDYEAQLHLASDIGHVLPALLNELHAAQHSPDRLAALVAMALIVAENVLDMNAARTAVSFMPPDSTTAASRVSLADIARLIYHTSFGDLDRAGVIAARVADARSADAGRGVVGLQQLRWATVPMSYLGNFSDAEAILLDVAARAKRQCLALESYEAAWHLTRLFIRQSDNDAAERWFMQSRRWSDHIPEELVRSSVSGLGAMLRLAQNRLDDALALMHESETYVVARPEGRTRSRFLSIKAAIQLRREGTIEPGVESDLVCLVSRSLSLGDVDLGASVIAHLYELRGETTTRELWLREFRLRRRERYMLPHFLRESFLPELAWSSRAAG